MQRIIRVRRIANPSSRRRKSKSSATKRRRTTRHRARSKNPLRVITLGAINPRRAKVKRRRKRSTVRRQTTRRRNASYTARPVRRRRRSLSAAPSRRRRNATRIVVRRNRRRRNQGGAIAGQMQEIFGGLVGVSATKFISSALSTNMPQLASTPIMASITSVGAAFAAGWVGGMWDKRFGDAVRFGGLMQAGSVMLNAFIPAIGGQLALRGMRGLGDLVPGAYPVPQNPLNPAQANYPAYGRPAMPAGNGNGTFGSGAPVTMNGVSRAFGRAF